MINLICVLVVLYIIYKIVLLVVFGVAIVVCKAMDGESKPVQAPVTMKRETFVWCTTDRLVVLGAIVITIILCASKVVYGW